MKERCINLKDWESAALVAGRLTQLRRPVVLQPHDWSATIPCDWYEPAVVGKDGAIKPGKPVYGFANEDVGWVAPAAPGDVLLGREAWLPLGFGLGILCRVDGVPPVGGTRWREACTMPKSLVRHRLRVVSVRCERAEAMTCEDVEECGVDVAAKLPATLPHGIPGVDLLVAHVARHLWEPLWDAAYGKRFPWSSNPWQWVLTVESERK